MFEFQNHIRLKQAQNALADGRLDEAFEIASAKEIRELRGGQQLLEGLIGPLLDRAAAHFAAGRLREAQLDVERAALAGGNRERTAELRNKVRAALDARELEARRQREVFESAQAHVQRGSFRTGLEAARELAAGSHELARLQREVESRERKSQEARARSLLHLERGEILEAIAGARDAIDAAPRDPELVEVRGKVKDAALAAARAALASGELAAGREILGRLEPLAGDGLDWRQLRDAGQWAAEAAIALEQHRYDQARLSLTRLTREHPGMAWAETGLREVSRILDALATLRSGPLGRAPGPEVGRLETTRTRVRNMPSNSRSPQMVAADDSLYLWVDGVGTYLLLLGDRVGIGRSGSSTRPQLALAAEMANYHAEILRSGDDYFLVAAQGDVQVGGKGVRRKLLADGEVIDLGASCRLTFKLPTAMSPTAALSFHRGLRLEGDVRQVLLVKDTVVLGPGPGSHVRTPGDAGKIVLSVGPTGLRCRAQQEILVDGRPGGLETEVRLGSHLQVGDLTFTMTGSTPGILPQLPSRDGAAGFPV